MDKTEEIYAKNFSGVTRDKLIAQHRKEKFFLEKKIQNDRIVRLKEEENVKDFIDTHKKEIDFLKNTYGQRR